MKNSFCGFYPPTEALYKELWASALVVVDANVLLSLYRLPATSKADLFKALEGIRERLWIPHQVALEFHRNRPTVISSERKAIEEALRLTNEKSDEITEKFYGLQIDKREIRVNSQSIVDEFSSAKEKLVNAIKAAHAVQLELSTTDAIRDRIDELFEGRVGPGPKSKEEMDSLLLNADERYASRVPPGFKDAEKDKNPNESTYVFDGIKYQKKFGDLILWRQLLAHAKAGDHSCVMLVTSDHKEDWWWREAGKTLGPHAELVREIKREAGIDLFWMYTSDQFLEQANSYLNANVSAESIAEVKGLDVWNEIKNPYEGEDSDFQKWTRSYFESTKNPVDLVRAARLSESQELRKTIMEWLKPKGSAVQWNDTEFPDFLVTRDPANAPDGFELKVLRQDMRTFFSGPIRDIAWKGASLIKSGKLSCFSIIVCVPQQYFLELMANQELSDALANRIAALLMAIPITSVIVGAEAMGQFLTALEQHRNS